MGQNSVMRNEFTAIIVPAEEGGFWAFCPEVPGANGQGETLEEVRENLGQTVELMLETQREDALAGIAPDALRETLIVG
jgi:predicted RNase H-like HicB family nuclease